MKRTVSILGLLFWLSACGGGGGGGGAKADPRLARLDAYRAQELRVLGDPAGGVPGLPITTEGNLPDSGVMAFAGFASLRVEIGTTPLVLFGDADLTVDFDGATVVGAVANLFGNSDTQTVADYEGGLSVLGNSTGQNLPLSYQGVLSAPGQVLGFDGQMTGVFLGDPVAAFSAADLEAEVDQNGTTRDATVVITLEATLAP